MYRNGFATWIKFLFGRARKTIRNKVNGLACKRLGFEQLEDRVLPAVNLLSILGGNVNIAVHEADGTSQIAVALKG